MNTIITTTLLMKVKDECATEFFGGLPMLMQETASSPGFVSAQAVRQDGSPNTILFVEQWESKHAFNDYMEWRTKRGDLEGLAQVLTGPPEINTWSLFSGQPANQPWIGYKK